MLRQWSYKEHWLDQGLDLPGSLYGDPKLTRMHLGKFSKRLCMQQHMLTWLADHCIEVLRANIMCKYAIGGRIPWRLTLSRYVWCDADPYRIRSKSKHQVLQQFIAFHSNFQSRRHSESVRISGQTISAAISGRSVNGSLTILLFLDLQSDLNLVYTTLFGYN
jgi:hypothetical protein